MQRFLSISSRFVSGGVLVGALFLFSGSSAAQSAVTSAQTGADSAMTQQIADLQKVVDRWDDAVGQRDQYALELVLAPEFIDISDIGDVANRDQVVARMIAKDAIPYALAQKVVTVRMVGDVAVVNGTYDRTYPGSHLSRRKEKDEKGVFSQVYRHKRNSWECVNSQRTLVAAAKSTEKKSSEKTEQKSLGHGLGFHLPGMSHSSSSDKSPQN